ncbi:MAG: DUF1643 domain-containing protein [Chloroflexi bacterium]|nr:DUF1643 domain-containing protein [Chloroflexota bacterium]
MLAIKPVNERNRARFSACGNYRYLLTREFGGDSTCLFIMLNPSSADAEHDDPTIRRCVSFALREGFGRLEVVNLYAFRTAEPAELFVSDDPVGSESDREILGAVERANVVVFAWGNHATDDRTTAVRNLLVTSGKSARCFGLTKLGQPRHPLYLRSDAVLAAL